MTNTSTERGGARQRPDYTAYKVDAIPEDITMPRSGPRVPPEFSQGIAQALNDPGGIYVVGTYYSDNGAHNMFKRIDKGEIKLPVGDWDLNPRRMWAKDEQGNLIEDEEGKPKRWSLLYAQYLGPVDGDDD